MNEKISESRKKLVVPPINLGGKVKKIPVSDILPGHVTTVNFLEAVVVFVDVLGFSHKTDSDEIEGTLVDFSAPLAIASTKVSECAF
jgi:hypothetical protein